MFSVTCILGLCETWSLILREERRLKVFENRVMRGIFWLKRDDVRGEWRKPLYDEINDLYCSPNIIRVIKTRRMRWTGHVASMGKRGVVYRDFVGKPEGKRPHGRPMLKWRIILRWILRKWDVVTWTGLISRER